MTSDEYERVRAEYRIRWAKRRREQDRKGMLFILVWVATLVSVNLSVLAYVSSLWPPYLLAAILAFVSGEFLVWVIAGPDDPAPPPAG